MFVILLELSVSFDKGCEGGRFTWVLPYLFFLLFSLFITFIIYNHSVSYYNI